jgi:DNA repair exonuclease SbcCD nuclease subunit
MRIIHISDTHLGKRPKRTRSSIINQEIKPLEDDFYNSWRRFIDEVINLNKDEKPDIIIHSGDFFETPSGTDPSPPPEFARKVAAETFKKLYQNNIPIVIIDGNHGRYMQYRISPLTEYTILFNNVYLFTYFDIRDSIRNQQPLFKDFSNLNLRIHAHPSIESNDLPQLLSKYEDWISLQNNNIDPNMINVGLAHGMIENHTLHSNFLMGNYDYIGLGDNHKMQQVNDNAWYAGSIELWSFSEESYQKGYLMIDIDDSFSKSKIRVIPKLLPQQRKIVRDNVEVFLDDTNFMVIDRIKSIFEKNGLNTPYNYQTAARVKITIRGNRSYGSFFNINEISSYLNRITLNSNEYNIVEFILETPKYYDDNIIIQNKQDNIFIEYLIEDPEKEFKKYITSTRKDDLKRHNLDSDMLGKLFFESLKNQ